MSGSIPYWSGTQLLQNTAGSSGQALRSGGTGAPTFGTLAVAAGGTGAVTLTGVLTGNGTSAMTANAVTQYAVVIGGASNAVGSTTVGNAGQVLQSSGAGVNPAYSTATYPLTTTINQVLYSSANNTVVGITASNNGVMISGTTGVPSWLAAGTTGQVLIATTGSPPSWGTAGSGNVVGPGSATDNALARYDGTTGKLLQDSSVIVSDAGEMTNSLQPAFLGVLGTIDTNVTGNAAVYTLGSGNALTEIFDQGGDFVTTGTFTSPVTGRYQLSFNLVFESLTALMTAIQSNIATSNRTYTFGFVNIGLIRTVAAASDLGISHGTVLADMDSGDTFTVSVAIYGGAGNTAGISASGARVFMSGYLAC